MPSMPVFKVIYLAMHYLAAVALFNAVRKLQTGSQRLVYLRFLIHTRELLNNTGSQSVSSSEIPEIETKKLFRALHRLRRFSVAQAWVLLYSYFMSVLRRSYNFIKNIYVHCIHSDLFSINAYGLRC